MENGLFYAGMLAAVIIGAMVAFVMKKRKEKKEGSGGAGGSKRGQAPKEKL